MNLWFSLLDAAYLTIELISLFDTNASFPTHSEIK